MPVQSSTWINPSRSTVKQLRTAKQSRAKTSQQRDATNQVPTKVDVLPAGLDADHVSTSDDMVVSPINPRTKAKQPIIPALQLPTTTDRKVTNHSHSLRSTSNAHPTPSSAPKRRTTTRSTVPPETKMNRTVVSSLVTDRVNLVADALHRHLPESADQALLAAETISRNNTAPLGVHSTSLDAWLASITHKKDRHHVEKLRQRVVSLHKEVRASQARLKDVSSSRGHSIGDGEGKGMDTTPFAKNNDHDQHAMESTYDSLSSIHFYSVSTQIGEGAFGKVWRGRHRLAQVCPTTACSNILSTETSNEKIMTAGTGGGKIV